MSSWTEILLILVAYCGGNHIAPTTDADKCRIDRLSCVKRAAVQMPKANAEELVNVCLASPNSFQAPAPTPSPAPSPKANKK